MQKYPKKTQNSHFASRAAKCFHYKVRQNFHISGFLVSVFLTIIRVYGKYILFGWIFTERVDLRLRMQFGVLQHRIYKANLQSNWKTKFFQMFCSPELCANMVITIKLDPQGPKANCVLLFLQPQQKFAKEKREKVFPFLQNSKIKSSNMRRTLWPWFCGKRHSIVVFQQCAIWVCRKLVLLKIAFPELSLHER